jgi:CubicO group peptidase (beta-lactamase class C family)
MHTLPSNRVEWKWSSPAQQDVDPIALATAFDEIARFQPLRSVLIARHGFLIGEYYADARVRATAINVHSVSKSILSLLVDIALREKWLPDLNQSIAVWLPEYFDAYTDARKRSITLRHLLTMSAGLGWIENPPSIRNWWGSADWVRYALSLPMVALPGRQFTYNTALTHLLSVILARASGMSTRALSERYLFGPLGIEVADWTTDPQGYHIGGTHIYLRPLDLLTLGQSVLARQLPDQAAIIPAAWITESTHSQIELRQPGFWHPAYKDYGYLWWLRKMQSHDVVVASGYAGQLVIIVRKLGLVITTTADDTIPFANVMKQSNLIEGIVEDLIIPAVQED